MKSAKTQQFSVWLRRGKLRIEFKLFNHEIEEMLPRVEIKIAGQGLNIIEKGAAGGQLLAQEAIFGINQV